VESATIGRVETIGVAGLVVGVMGVVVAVVALARSVPTFAVSDSVQGRYVISHTGPGAVVVRRAWVEDAGGIFPINSDLSQVEMFDVDGFPFPPPDGPSFGESCEIQPHRRYHITMNVNRSVVFQYRAAGFLGFMSKAELRINEGP